MSSTAGKRPEMTPTQWKRVEELLAPALTLPPAARRDFLDRECAGDGMLRSELESLLATHDRSGPLDRPVGELAEYLTSRATVRPVGTVVLRPTLRSISRPSHGLDSSRTVVTSSISTRVIGPSRKGSMSARWTRRKPGFSFTPTCARGTRRPATSSSRATRRSWPNHSMPLGSKCMANPS